VSISKCRRYSIWTGIIVITAVICLSILGVCSTAEPREREGNTPWIKRPFNKLAYKYNNLPARERYARFNEMIQAKTLLAEPGDCEVTEDHYKGTTKSDIAVWAVKCSNGNAYVIMILINESAFAISCETFEAYGVTCF
jgi:hypothetical protein